MSNLLFFLAVFPVLILCFYIYKKDNNKEPIPLLLKLFFLGFVMSIPIVIVEMMLSAYFPTDNVTDFIKLFVSVFVGVALVEEGGKWLIVKFIGYNNKEFDEIYDVIVYSVFVSLGFACIENILYVFQSGLGIAIGRALLSIPGHMCFGVLMGYFLSKAKINQVNNNKSLYTRNMLLSIFFPSLIHAIYDTLIFYTVNTMNLTYFWIFLLFDILMVVICLRTVKIVSKMQFYIRQGINNGHFVNNNGQLQLNNTAVTDKYNFCPICGKPGGGMNYCSRCGYKLSK